MGKVVEYIGDETVILNTSTIRINEKDKNVKRTFLKWVLQSKYLRKQLGLMMTGSCQPNFGPSRLSKAIMCLPKNSDKQKEIISFLDQETSKINKTINKIKSKIELLEEYKKSLIYYVVTGKVDVRGVG